MAKNTIVAILALVVLAFSAEAFSQYFGRKGFLFEAASIPGNGAASKMAPTFGRRPLASKGAGVDRSNLFKAGNLTRAKASVEIFNVLQRIDL